MAKIDFPKPVMGLVAELKKLPGIGTRSAERIAVWMIQHKRANPLALSDALTKANEDVYLCTVCGFFADQKGCSVCDAIGRDTKLICVVEQATDVLPIERSGAYSGQFHCLGGKLSPLDNVTPEDLRISSLLHRVHAAPQTEVILALSTDVEGEATAHYLSDLLKNCDCKVTRIAQGLPAGGGLENADQLTLMRALEGRR
jgi:recombination protein RecR